MKFIKGFICGIVSIWTFLLTIFWWEACQDKKVAKKIIDNM